MDQWSVFFGARKYTRTPGKNNTIIIVILKLYLLINFLNHRVNIMLRERVFNFTASLVGNLTVNRTGTFRLSPRLFLPRGSEKVSPFTALQKNKANSINKPGRFTSHDLSSWLFFLLCSWVLIYGYLPVFILWVIGQKSSTNSFWKCPNRPLLIWTPSILVYFECWFKTFD